MRILVTGGAGFLGGHVARGLRAAGHDVTVFDRLRGDDRMPTIEGDLLDFADVLAAVEYADAVCHLAAIGDVYLAFENPPLAATVNATGTANVLEAAKRSGTRRVAYASTWEVYGEPVYSPMDEHHPTSPDHPYNITKLAGEQLVLSYDKLKGVQGVALRLGTAYGTGMRPNSVFSIFINKAAQEQPIAIDGDGKQGRQFTHASDIAAAFCRAIESDVHGETFNIVGDEYVTIGDLAEAVARALPTRVEYRPARVGDVPSSALVSNQRARDVLGWSPATSFSQGLADLIAWQTSLGRATADAGV